MDNEITISLTLPESDWRIFIAKLLAIATPKVTFGRDLEKMAILATEQQSALANELLDTLAIHKTLCGLQWELDNTHG